MVFPKSGLPSESLVESEDKNAPFVRTHPVLQSTSGDLPGLENSERISLYPVLLAF